MKKTFEFDPTNLREIVEKTGMTNVQIATATGVPVNAMNNYLRGTATPTLDAAIRMGDYFAVPLDYLMGRCSEKCAKRISRNYGANFMELRRAPYEQYLLGPARVSGARSDKTEAPWPYNLLEDLFWEWNDPIKDWQMENLERALSKMSEREQYCVFQHYKEGVTETKLAEELGVSKHVVHNTILRGLRKLRYPHILNRIQYSDDVLELKDSLQTMKWDLEKAQKKILREKAEIKKERALLSVDPLYLDSLKRIKIDDKPIDDFGVSRNTREVLYRANCYTIGRVVALVTSGCMEAIEFFDEAAREEILACVERFTGVRYDSAGNVVLVIDKSTSKSGNSLPVWLSDMHFSAWTHNTLVKRNCKTIRDVVTLVEAGALTNEQIFDKKATREILRKVEERTGRRYDQSGAYIGGRSYR